MRPKHALISWVILWLFAENSLGALIERTLVSGVTARLARLETPGQSNQLRSLVLLGSTQRLLMMVASRRDDEDAAATRLYSVLGNLMSDGDIGAQAMKPLSTGSSSLGLPENSPLAGRLLVSNTAGVAYTVSVDMSGAVQLTRLNSSGQVDQRIDVPLTLNSIAIRRVLSLGDTGFLLIGSAGSRPMLMQIDALGRVINSTVIPEDDAAAIAAFPTTAGRMTVLLEKGTTNDPRFWIGDVSVDGSTGRYAEFAGRPLDMAIGSDKQVVVLVEQSGVLSRDAVARGFDQTFALQWSRTLMSEHMPLGRFRIVPIASGGYLVAGRKERGLWLSRLSSIGTEMWTDWTNPVQASDLEMTLDIDMTQHGSNIVLGYSALVVRARRQVGVVRALQFRLD